MNTCPNCGNVAGLHSSILQGCMCQYSMQAPPQPEQEPVACGTYQEVTDLMNALWAGTLEQIQIAEELKNKKLYTTPPQRTWQGLTEEDKKQMAKEANYHWEMTAGEYAERIGQLTEAKLKEKNGA